MHKVNKNTKALLSFIMQTGLEMNAERSKYMVKSRGQNAGQNHDIRRTNKSFASVAKFKRLLTAITNHEMLP